jgi:hypothetical protein
MKVTHRTLEAAARAANAGVLKDYPFGLRVEPAGMLYRLSLLHRKSVAIEPQLVVGTPREVLAAITAVVAFAGAAKTQEVSL